VGARSRTSLRVDSRSSTWSIDRPMSPRFTLI